jgi:hypothetical protein
LVLIIGLISAIVTDLAVLANLFRLELKAYNPLEVRIKKKSVSF